MLTKKDLETLLDAVDAWVEKDRASNMMASLFTGLVASRDPMGAAKLKAADEDARLKYEEKRTQRKRAAILLKAELVRMIADIEETERAAEAQRRSVQS